MIETIELNSFVDLKIIFQIFLFKGVVVEWDITTITPVKTLEWEVVSTPRGAVAQCTGARWSLGAGFVRTSV